MITRTKPVTAEDLLLMTHDNAGKRYELVRGELREMPPAGGYHGTVAFTIASIIGAHIRGKDLGVGFTAETGFVTRRAPDSVRAPDVAFVSKERLGGGRAPDGFVQTAPDLAVEVVSPNDSAMAIDAKVKEYFSAGARLVWVVYPVTMSVTVHRSPGETTTLNDGDTLEGEPVFEDFHVQVSDLFG